MPTLSRIKEESFRIGSGRYIQENGAIKRVGDEVIRLHADNALVIGGVTALSLTRSDISISLEERL